MAHNTNNSFAVDKSYICRCKPTNMLPGKQQVCHAQCQQYQVYWQQSWPHCWHGRPYSRHPSQQTQLVTQLVTKSAQHGQMISWLHNIYQGQVCIWSASYRINQYHSIFYLTMPSMHHITMADGFSIDQVVQYCDLHFSSILKALNMASNAKSNIIVQNLLKELVCLHCLVTDSSSILLQIETFFILHWFGHINWLSCHDTISHLVTHTVYVYILWWF